MYDGDDGTALLLDSDILERINAIIKKIYVVCLDG